MISESFDRRAFLGWCTAALVSVGLAACAKQPAGPQVEIGALHEFFADRRDIEQIGKYAVKSPEIGDRQPRIAAALSPNGSETWIGATPAPALRKHLRDAIAADFERDRILDVAGWQLPRTEARVAALIYLSK